MPAYTGSDCTSLRLTRWSFLCSQGKNSPSEKVWTASSPSLLALASYLRTFSSLACSGVWTW